MMKILTVALLLQGIMSFSCFADDKVLEDGVYEGRYSFVTVEVRVEGNRFSDIRMLKHGGGGEKYASMVKPMMDEMIEKQTVDVDGITGATVSSENLKKAVGNAVQKAYR
jgi:uncharacterized protein with FMN-binding domain